MNSPTSNHQPSALTALSPLDGRYQAKVDALRAYTSEFALIRHRVLVEIHWLLALAEADLPAKPQLPADAPAKLLALAQGFGLDDAKAIQQIEQRTNHDVKAVEYWLKAQLQTMPGMQQSLEWVHFACTSEDINNCAYALMLKGARDAVMLPQLDALIERFVQMAKALAAKPMLARTHGQSASPTTMGKEMANVAARLQTARARLAQVPVLAKINGAVGNFNAHSMAFADFDWPALAKQVVEQRLGLVYNPLTTQIEPHDWIAELLDAQARVNTILLDAARDFWGYISLGYFTQQSKAEEVGSSAMPHKVNPIDFENAEGNLGLANAILRHLSDKLPVSRWQRDLTDSTVLRNLGVALGHALLAMTSLNKGMNKLSLNQARIEQDLQDAWEVLAEAVQTVMRRWGLPEPYEQLKQLTRGRPTTQALLHEFIQSSALPEAEKTRLLALRPADYVGLASKLAQAVRP